jgi:hypothetical protein
MKVLSGIELACEVARKHRKPVLFLGLSQADEVGYAEILKAAPYLTYNDSQALVDGEAVIICDSVEEQNRLYWQTVGDDGPTDTNPYDGKARVYALTIDKTGQTLNENT